MDLKELVFFRIKAELDGLASMERSGGYSVEELENQSRRFTATYQIVEEAGLEKEFEAWCKKA